MNKKCKKEDATSIAGSIEFKVNAGELKRVIKSYSSLLGIKERHNIFSSPLKMSIKAFLGEVTFSLSYKKYHLSYKTKNVDITTDGYIALDYRNLKRFCKTTKNKKPIWFLLHKGEGFIKDPDKFSKIECLDKGYIQLQNGALVRSFRLLHKEPTKMFLHSL